MPARVQVSARRSIASGGAGCGSKGPSVVPGLEDAAGREGGAADDALDVLGDRLLVADAVLH
jgi:hypothetical protein